jgi:uncharacterized protein YraI
MSKRILTIVFLILLSPMLTQVDGQSTGVTAEAIGSANLRSVPGLDGELLGEILAGTQYPVIGRSEFYPWVLLGDVINAAPIGWVFQDLVTIHGNLASVPVSSQEVVPGQSAPIQTPLGMATSTLLPDVQMTPPAGQTFDATFTPTPTPTLPTGIYGVAGAEINVRYGPGTDYQPLARAFAGDTFLITGYHTQFPWVQVAFEDSPNGFAWIAMEILDIQGNVYETQQISTTNFNLPTLTPTPAMRSSSNIPGGQAVPVSDTFGALGDSLWDFILSRGFVLETSRFGALYLQDLQTGEAITYGNDIAFSGTSINKIAILLAYFGVMDTSPDLADARDIANTMICSENVATNRLLSAVGNGDALLGAENTTQLMRDLGMTRTFITAPYDTTTALATSTPMPRAPQIPRTDADQIRSNPNPTNQMTVEEMGWLLANVYQCAYNESGPLIDNFDGAFTSQECRKMLYIMGENTVDGLLKAGAPEGIRVAHKHGWVTDTHGNAGVFFTPGGDYVMVMMLHEPVFLNFVSDSLPTLAHTSMRVFNHYNPLIGLTEPREGYIPTPDQCNYGTNDPIVQNLASSTFMFNNDSSTFFNPATSPIETEGTATPTLRPTWTPEWTPEAGQGTSGN